MRALHAKELEGLQPLEEGDSGLETVETISLNDLTIAAFYDEGTDLFTVDLHEIGKVVARYEQCNGIKAMQVLMSEVKRAWGER